MLASSRSCPMLACERGAGGTDSVQLIVFAAQPPLSTARPLDRMHLLTLALQVTGETGAVVAGTLDRPEPTTRRVPTGEANGIGVAVSAGGRCRLRDHRAGVRVDDRDRVLVAMGVDADHVVHLLCKHSTDPPTRRVRYAGLEQGTARQVCDESRPEGGQAPDQANGGRQAGVAVHTRTIHSQDTHDAVRHLMSHERHDDNQPGNGP